MERSDTVVIRDTEAEPTIFPSSPSPAFLSPSTNTSALRTASVDPRETRRPQRLPSVTNEEVSSAMRSVSVPTEPAQQRPGWSEALAAVRSNAGQRPSPAAESVPSEPRQPLTQSPEAPSRVISDIETQLDNGESNTRLFLNNAQRRIDDIRTRFQAQIRVDSFWSGSEMERDFMDRQEQAPAQPIPTTDAAPVPSIYSLRHSNLADAFSTIGKLVFFTVNPLNQSCDPK